MTTPAADSVIAPIAQLLPARKNDSGMSKHRSRLLSGNVPSAQTSHLVSSVDERIWKGGHVYH